MKHSAMCDKQLLIWSMLHVQTVGHVQAIIAGKNETAVFELGGCQGSFACVCCTGRANGRRSLYDV